METSTLKAYTIIRVFAQQISHLEISRALDFFLGNFRNLRRLFEISAGFGNSEQEITNLPSHSRIIWGGKSRKIEINLERKHSILYYVRLDDLTDFNLYGINYTVPV